MSPMADTKKNCHIRRLVPVALHVVEVELDHGPERVGDVAGAVAVREEPVRVGDHRGRAEGGAIYMLLVRKAR